MRKFHVDPKAQSLGGRTRKRARLVERMLYGLTRRTAERDLTMLTVKRDRCDICRSTNLEDAYVGPWVVCLDCRQVQSRYTQREHRPDETVFKLKCEPRYNLNDDLSELE